MSPWILNKISSHMRFIVNVTGSFWNEINLVEPGSESAIESPYHLVSSLHTVILLKS